MRTGSIFGIAGLIIMILGVLTATGGVNAQEGTPTAGAATEEAIAPGVTFGLVPASEDPPALYRLRLQSGAVLPFAGDPAISLVYVESGELALQMAAPVSDARSDAGDANATESTVVQGDYFVLPPLVAGEMRNEGQDAASIIVAAITPALFPAPAAGTPTAG